MISLLCLCVGITSLSPLPSPSPLFALLPSCPSSPPPLLCPSAPRALCPCAPLLLYPSTSSVLHPRSILTSIVLTTSSGKKVTLSTPPLTGHSSSTSATLWTSVGLALLCVRWERTTRELHQALLFLTTLVLFSSFYHYRLSYLFVTFIINLFSIASNGKGITLIYGNGDPTGCPNKKPRSTILNFVSSFFAFFLCFFLYYSLSRFLFSFIL